MNINYSKAIDLVIHWIENNNWSVERYAFDLPDNIAGRTHYNKRTIELNCASAEIAFITVCHEAGHMLSYFKRNKNRDSEDFEEDKNNIFYTKERRENLAYLYGWYFIKKFGPHIISKEKWKRYHGY